MTKVTESMNLDNRVELRGTGPMTRCDGVDGVEAKVAPNRDSQSETALLRFVVATTVPPRHPPSLEKERELEKPVGRGSRGRDGVGDGPVSQTQDFVTLRHRHARRGLSDATPRSLNGGSDRVGTGFLEVRTAVVTPAVTGGRVMQPLNNCPMRNHVFQNFRWIALKPMQ